MSASYTPYLIAAYSTGLDQSVQPWLLPDEAQHELFDGYVYRGEWNKRPGYDQFATGERNGSVYTESRIVVTITDEAYGTGDDTPGPFTHTAANVPLSRGSITITAGAQSATDDGLGSFVTSPAGGSGSVNYTNGQMSITFNSAVAAATPITVTYDYFPGLPGMMCATFVTDANIKELIVSDTRNVNRYNSTTNRLEFLPHSTTFTGDSSNFFTWTSYPDASDDNRLLFTNSIDTIQEYDGTSISNYGFTLSGVTTLSALLMFQMKDRLILLRTREDGTIFGRRIRISGTGANSDVFDTTATGAGLIEIPDSSWIVSAAFNRDDLIIFTQYSVWVMEFTGSDVTPFQLRRLDSSRGSYAPYSGITYLNRTTTLSPNGMILTDGYRVERMDNKLPDYSFNQIDQTNFDLCFAGAVDEDRDHYLIHPSPQESQSNRILITNYEEDNFSVYRIPLSCMGTFEESFNTTWDDLSVYSNWDEMAVQFGNWETFSYTKGLPFPVGMGHEGQVFRMNINGLEDYSARIRNATVIDTHTLEIETDFQNYELGDYIFISGMTGMEEGNDKQGAIKSIETANRVFRLDINTTRFSSYTSGGYTARVIPFQSKTKKFNPFSQVAQKVRCGYLYMYVSASNTGLTRNSNIDGISLSNPAVVDSNNHGFESGQILTVYGVSGMTEINGKTSSITVIDENSFSLDQIDSSSFSAYTSGGVASGPEKCFIDIQVITNDENDFTQLENSSLQTIPKPYRIDCTPNRNDEGAKRWVKIYINQTARFIQFNVTNTQALSVIRIQAMMPGFAGVGRLI